jgi:hypothetical protein
VAAAAFAVLAAGLGRLPQGARADEPIHVETRAVVVGPPQVTIDIEPCCKCNIVILTRSCLGVVPVAIITTPEFDATTVDPHTVRFAGAPAMWWKAVDVDHDGDKDLLLMFKTKQTNLAPGDTQACLDGQTFDGVAIHACDRVHVVGLDRWWKPIAAAARIMSLDGVASGNVSEGTGLTAALDASSGPVAPPPTVTLSPDPAEGATPIATPDLGGAGLAPETIATPSTGPAEGATPTATPGSNPVLLPPSGGDGDLSTEGWPWLLLLAGGGLPLTLMVGLVWFRRPRRR